MKQHYIVDDISSLLIGSAVYNYKNKTINQVIVD